MPVLACVDTVAQAATPPATAAIRRLRRGRPANDIRDNAQTAACADSMSLLGGRCDLGQPAAEQFCLSP